MRFFSVYEQELIYHQRSVPGHRVTNLVLSSHLVPCNRQRGSCPSSCVQFAAMGHNFALICQTLCGGSVRSMALQDQHQLLPSCIFGHSNDCIIAFDNFPVFYLAIRDPSHLPLPAPLPTLTHVHKCENTLQPSLFLHFHSPPCSVKTNTRGITSWSGSADRTAG